MFISKEEIEEAFEYLKNNEFDKIKIPLRILRKYDLKRWRLYNKSGVRKLK